MSASRVRRRRPSSRTSISARISIPRDSRSQPGPVTTRDVDTGREGRCSTGSAPLESVAGPADHVCKFVIPFTSRPRPEHKTDREHEQAGESHADPFWWCRRLETEALAAVIAASPTVTMAPVFMIRPTPPL